MRKRFASILCVAASIACLALIGLGLFKRLRPGNHDDKTLHYATSAIRPGNLAAVFELGAALPVIVAACPSFDAERCRARTTIRVSTLLNYPALSATIRLARSLIDRSNAPLCQRVARAYTAGFVLLHASVWALFMILILTDRSSGRRFSIAALLMSLAAAATLPYLGFQATEWIAGGMIPPPPPAHFGHYAPRGALALVFLLQAAAFVSGRYRAWMGLSLLGPSLHLAQALLLDSVFIVALALRVVFVAEERASHVRLLAFAAALAALCLLAARAIDVSGGLAATLPRIGAVTWKLHDLLWLSGGLVSLAAVISGRTKVSWIQPLLFLAAFLFVLTAIDVMASSLDADPGSSTGDLFARFYGGSSFVLGALPWLAGTLLIWRIARAALPRLRVSMITVAAIIVIGACAAIAIGRREAVAAAWRQSAWNLAAVSTKLCRVAPCRRGCDFRGFGAMTPGNERLFHLQIFDYLNRYPAFGRDLNSSKAGLAR